MKRKTFDFIFTTHYEKGADNVADEISRIKTWSNDPDRMNSVSDFEDEGYKVYASSISNHKIYASRDDLELESSSVQNEFSVMITQVKKLENESLLTNIVCGSWSTTPRKYRNEMLIRIFANY